MNLRDDLVLENRYLKIQFGEIGASIIKFIDKATGIDIVLGYDDLDSYLINNKYFGVTVGRVANRIAEAKYSLNGQTYQMEANNGPNLLHGGNKALSHQKFEVLYQTDSYIKFGYLIKNDGFNGQVNLVVKYTLENHSLLVEYMATSDEDTIVNLTNHSYFNLNGNNDLSNHYLTLNADYYHSVNQDGLITNQVNYVQGTAFDFRKASLITERLKLADRDLKIAKGFDHFFIANKLKANLAIIETDKLSLEVSSSYPGFQLYSANYVSDEIGKNNLAYQIQNSICVEASYLPNGINFGNEDSILRKGQEYHEYIQFTLKHKEA